MESVYLSGQYLPLEQATVSVLDRGFLFGDGVYEVIPIYHGEIFRGDEHLRRLQESLNAINLDFNVADYQWDKIFCELLKDRSQSETDQMIYIQITRGKASHRTHAPPEKINPTVFVQISALPSLSIEELKQGFKAITLPDLRWQCCHIKSINLLCS